MKKNNLFNIATKLLGFAIVMAVLAALSSFYVAGITMALTGAVVSGEPVSMEEVRAGSPTLDLDYVSKKVTEMRPAATPLDTIMRQIGNQVAIKSFITDYYAVDSRPLYDTVNTAYTKAGDGNASYALIVNNVGMWNVDDTLMVLGITGVDSLDLICFVSAKNVSANTITIQPLNGIAGSGTTAGLVIIPATIPINTRLVRLGTAKNELDAQHSPYAIIPVKAFNYMQIFAAQVEEGRYQRDHLKEVDYNFTDYEAQNIYDMRATMELSYLFGYRMRFYDVAYTKERYTTGGITRYIANSLEYGTGGSDRTIDNSTFIDWTKEIFTGNSGAETRIFFGGDGLTANLCKVDTVQKQIEAKQTQVKWGITFNEIETNFGVLLYKHHPLFSYAGWGDKGVVLDMNHIEKHTYKPMQITKLDLVSSGQRLVDAVVITEASGVITRYPDVHAIIGPKA
jgi:hypothetical protein